MYLTVFILLTCTILQGILAHILYMRLSIGKHAHLSAITCFTVLIICNLALAHLWGFGVTMEGALTALVFMGSFCVFYSLLLVGIVNDSPTLAIVKAVVEKEPDRFSISDKEKFIEKHPFIDSRLTALVATGDIYINEQTVHLTRRSRTILSILSLYQTIASNNTEKG